MCIYMSVCGSFKYFQDRRKYSDTVAGRLEQPAHSCQYIYAPYTQENCLSAIRL